MIEVNHEYYVDLEVAELLKEAGFDWKVNHYYFTQNGKTEAKSDFRHPAQNYNESMATMDSKSFEFEVCSRPTLDMAQRWIRKVKDLSIEISSEKNLALQNWYMYTIVNHIGGKVTSDEFWNEEIGESLYNDSEHYINGDLYYKKYPNRRSGMLLTDMEFTTEEGLRFSTDEDFS